MSDGETPEQALQEVQDAIASWIESAEHHKKPVPNPGTTLNFVQRLPASLHLRLSVAARSEGVSLNTYLIGRQIITGGSS
jgi:antitoxin HicB